MRPKSTEITRVFRNLTRLSRAFGGAVSRDGGGSAGLPAGEGFPMVGKNVSNGWKKRACNGGRRLLWWGSRRASGGMADAPDLGSGPARGRGSTPLSPMVDCRREGPFARARPEIGAGGGARFPATPRWKCAWTVTEYRHPLRPLPQGGQKKPPPGGRRLLGGNGAGNQSCASPAASRRKKSIVVRTESSIETFGSQPRSSLALRMEGLRWMTSW